MANTHHRIATITASAQDIVRLNVGGQKFTTKRLTLCQIEGSLLSAMFSGCGYEGLQRDNEGCVFLDFNPKLFALIMDYLRARMQVPTPQEHVACLPEVNPKDMVHLKHLVNYLGLADEFQLNTDEKCVFGPHSHGIELQSNRTYAWFRRRGERCFPEYPNFDEGGNFYTNISGERAVYSMEVNINNDHAVVLSENTYRNGVIRWKLLFGGRSSMGSDFVGVVKEEAAFTLNVDSMSDGIFGWTTNPSGDWDAIIDKHMISTQLTPGENMEFFELKLDCQRKTLEIFFINGKKYHISLPNSVSGWKLRVVLTTGRSVEIIGQ